MKRSASSITLLILWIWCTNFSSAHAQRTVFAHFMLANQDYIADDAPPEAVIASYQREIRQAQAVGIDGFALNAGGWFKEPRYIRRAAEMFEAAYRLNSGFKLMFSADMCCSNDAEDVEDMVRRFANSSRYAPLYYRDHGRFLLTTFAGTKQGPAFWAKLRKDLESGSNPSSRDAPGALADVRGVPSSKPLPITLIPAFFWGGEAPVKADIAAGLDAYQQVIDGAFYWGIAAVPGLGHTPDQIPSSEAYAAALHGAGKQYLAPICLQFWGANAHRYYEYSGYSGMRRMWMDAIQVTHPEMVEIITWNDFIEGTYVSPIDDAGSYAGANDLGTSAAPPATLRQFHSHAGATALLAYFIRWYKTGVQPVLYGDTVYWAYRTVTGPPSAADAIKLYGPVADVVYITANLVAPAVLQVKFGEAVRSVSLPAGSTDVEVPMTAGSPPVFTLMRGTTQMLHGTGADPIASDSRYPNLYYSTGTMAGLNP